MGVTPTEPPQTCMEVAADSARPVAGRVTATRLVAWQLPLRAVATPKDTLVLRLRVTGTGVLERRPCPPLSTLTVSGWPSGPVNDNIG